jgi:manganese-dependent inorganic pyrophosphatase
MYKESRVEIPKEIASIMMGGIISDTLALTSPTTTNVDIEVMKELEKISGLNYKEYAKDIFNSSIKLNEKSEAELINLDIKSFHYGNGRSFKVSQVVTMNSKDILARKDKLINELDKIREDKDLDFALLLITDISTNGSYILYSDTQLSHNMLSRAFNKEVYPGMFLPLVVSRKKQVIPMIMEID